MNSKAYVFPAMCLSTCAWNVCLISPLFRSERGSEERQKKRTEVLGAARPPRGRLAQEGVRSESGFPRTAVALSGILTRSTAVSAAQV